MNHLLAASDFDLVVGIIVMIIWGIAALAGKLKNAMTPRPGSPPGSPQPTPLQRLQQEIADQIRQMNEGQAARMPPPLPSDRRPPARQQQQRRRMQPVAAPPPPAKPALQTAPPVAAAAKPKPPTVQAPTIRRWLTPTTLRQQFILTELFQPPLSMREEQR